MERRHCKGIIGLEECSAQDYHGYVVVYSMRDNIVTKIQTDVGAEGSVLTEVIEEIRNAVRD